MVVEDLEVIQHDLLEAGVSEDSVLVRLPSVIGNGTFATCGTILQYSKTSKTATSCIHIYSK